MRFRLRLAKALSLVQCFADRFVVFFLPPFELVSTRCTMPLAVDEEDDEAPPLAPGVWKRRMKGFPARFFESTDADAAPARALAKVTRQRTRARKMRER